MAMAQQVNLISTFLFANERRERERERERERLKEGGHTTRDLLVFVFSIQSTPRLFCVQKF